MKWVLSRRVPAVTRLLLVESGPREVAEKVFPRLREVFGDTLPIDLLTCLPTNPKNYLANGQTDGSVWRVNEQTDDAGRWRLLRQIRSRRHPVTAIICAGDGIMAPWKKAVLLLLPSKFLVVNENADFFWIDSGHWRDVSRFLLYRAGLFEDSAVRTLARALAFPLTLTYLLGYAAYVHTVRLVRLGLGLHRRRPDLEEAPD